MKFLEQVEALLQRHAGDSRYEIICSRDYPQQGCAFVDVVFYGVKLRFELDRNFDYWIDVASVLEPDAYLYLRELLLLVSGGPIERSRVQVGHDVSDLGEVLKSLLEHRDEVAMALAPEHLANTRERLAVLHQELMHPALLEVTNRK